VHGRERQALVELVRGARQRPWELSGHGVKHRPQQQRLADTWFALDQDQLTLARSRLEGQVSEVGQLLVPAYHGMLRRAPAVAGSAHSGSLTAAAAPRNKSRRIAGVHALGDGPGSRAPGRWARPGRVSAESRDVDNGVHQYREPVKSTTGASTPSGQTVTESTAQQRFTVVLSAQARQLASSADINLSRLAASALNHINALLPGSPTTITVDIGHPSDLIA